MAVALAACVGLAPLFAGSRAAAQGTGTILGDAKDEHGKALAGVTVILHPINGGADTTLTTDKSGHFEKSGLPVGSYVISYKQNDATLYQVQGAVVANREIRADLDMNDPKVAEYVKRVKTNAEEEAKEGKVTTHYNAGKAALTQEHSLRDQVGKASADQKADLQAQMDQQATTAVGEFKEALTGVDATDNKNRVALYDVMGEAYDLDGKNAEAADAYQKSLAITPDAAIYNNLGNVLAKQDKMDEAKAAYQKSGELDPANAAKAYRNFAIVLYNVGKLAGSPAPDLLQKATQLEPNNTQGWYLLGVALVANMPPPKQEGDKMTFTLLPGTVEAFQKCIELDPNGPFAAQAKQQIEELKALGVPIDMKVTAPRTKH
jgi:tetratricopeptide (TPR) repeat protein